MAQEEERSAANKLKSKAIKEAKLLLKLEGKSRKVVRRVEVKLKPQSETTGYTSGYVKKPTVSSNSYDKIKQQQKQIQKEYEEKQILNGIIESFQSVKITDNNEEEIVENLDIKAMNKAMKSESKPVKSIVARTTDGVSTGNPVYIKLKRRDESYDNEEEEEEEEEKRNFSSLEALDDRMDELYGELDSKSEVQVPVDLSPKIPVASYNDGSDSKNPIKWRNGRLVSDKDRFFESMKVDAEAELELELELEMNGVRSENTEKSQNEKNNEKNKMKASSLPVNKKVVVELTGVTMKKMLEHLEVSIGFEGLYEETNLRCFSVKPSITSSLKVLRQAPLEWARKKIEYLYIQSKKRL